MNNDETISENSNSRGEASFMQIISLDLDVLNWGDNTGHYKCQAWDSVKKLWFKLYVWDSS